MAKYKKRKDGRYESKVTVGRDFNTGKSVRLTVYGKTISELEMNKAIIKADYLRGINVSHKKITFIEYAKKWLKIKKPFVENRTYELHKIKIMKHSIKLHNLDMKQITKMTIQEVINDNIMYPRTCQMIRQTLNQIFDSAIQDDIVYKNPTKGLQLPRYECEEKRALTEEEDYLSDVVSFTDRECAYVMLIKWCGLRREEVLALNKNSFDFDNRLVHIENAVEFINGKPHFKKTKTKAGERYIPLTNNCYNFIKYYVNNLKTDYLFSCIRSNEMITLHSFRRMWESIIKKMNNRAVELNYRPIKNLTSHVFRHNYATILYKIGVDAKEAQYLLGHASYALTMDIYTHVNHKELSATEKLLKYEMSSESRQHISDAC